MKNGNIFSTFHNKCKLLFRFPLRSAIQMESSLLLQSTARKTSPIYLRTTASRQLFAIMKRQNEVIV